MPDQKFAHEIVPHPGEGESKPLDYLVRYHYAQAQAWHLAFADVINDPGPRLDVALGQYLRRERAKRAQNEVSDLRSIVGTGNDLWTTADSAQAYLARANAAEAAYAALVARVKALAAEWEAEAKRACGDTSHYGYSACPDCGSAGYAAALRALTEKEQDRG